MQRNEELKPEEKNTQKFQHMLTNAHSSSLSLQPLHPLPYLFPQDTNNAIYIVCINIVSPAHGITKLLSCYVKKMMRTLKMNWFSI